MFSDYKISPYWLAAGLATIVSATACAQEGSQGSLAGTAVISSVRVIDGLGGTPKENQDILIGEGKIIAIGSSGSLTIPDNAVNIDGSGKTAMPGLIDMHIHTQGGWGNGLIPGERYASTYDDESVQQRQNGYLYAGVTTTLDLGVDHDWIISRDRQTTYSNLPPGEYTFSITSTENDAFAKEPVVSYSFKINAPIWMQPWFLLLSIGTIVALIYFIIKERERQLQRQADLKKERIADSRIFRL